MESKIKKVKLVHYKQTVLDRVHFFKAVFLSHLVIYLMQSTNHIAIHLSTQLCMPPPTHHCTHVFSYTLTQFIHLLIYLQAHVFKPLTSMSYACTYL